MNDATQLRNRQKALAESIERQRQDEDTGTPRFPAIIVRETGDPWPPASKSSYHLKLAAVSGGTTIGSTLTAVAVGAAFLGTNLGAGTPPDPSTLDVDHKTLVLVVGVGSINYFYYGAV